MHRINSKKKAVVTGFKYSQRLGCPVITGLLQCFKTLPDLHKLSFVD